MKLPPLSKAAAVELGEGATGVGVLRAAAAPAVQATPAQAAVLKQLVDEQVADPTSDLDTLLAYLLQDYPGGLAYNRNFLVRLRNNIREARRGRADARQAEAQAKAQARERQRELALGRMTRAEKRKRRRMTGSGGTTPLL